MNQWLVDPGEAEAEITRPGWLYEIRILHGLTSCGDWYAFSRAGAEKKARRKLAWYKRKFGPPRERWTVQ